MTEDRLPRVATLLVRMQAVRRLGGLAALGTGLGVLALHLPFRINLSQSMPIGLYRVRTASLALKQVDRGDTVMVCLAPRLAALGVSRGYLPRRGGCLDGRAPIGKPIVAVSGDRVTVDTGGIRVNGERIPNSKPLGADAKGRALSGVPTGQYVVRNGQVWIVSSFSGRSWDSRYWGPVGVGSVTGVLHTFTK